MVIKTAENDTDLECFSCQEAAADENGNYYEVDGHPFCETCAKKHIAEIFEF